MIDEGHEALDGQRLAEERPQRVLEVVLDADVHRGVVHVVLDAFAEHILQAHDVLAEVEIGAQVEALPVASPDRSMPSSSMSSHLITRSAPAAHVAPVLPGHCRHR